MVFIISKKFMMKNWEKLVAPKDYALIDGENYGATGNMGVYDTIAEKFNNCVTLGAFTPDRYLLNILKKKKEGEMINERKEQREIKEWLSSIDFIGSCCAAIKTQGAYGVEKDINVFIIIPTIVYKSYGKYIQDKIHKILKWDIAYDFQFVYLQRDIDKQGEKLLMQRIPKKVNKQIARALVSAEKRYDLNNEKLIRNCDDESDY